MPLLEAATTIKSLSEQQSASETGKVFAKKFDVKTSMTGITANDYGDVT